MKKSLFLALSTAVLVTACGPILEPRPDTAHYYHLSESSLPPLTPATPLPDLAISVPRLRLPSYLERSEIVLRSGNQLLIDNNNLWLEPPGQAATRIFASRLARRLGTEKLALAPTLDIYPDALQVNIQLLQFDGSPTGDFILHAYWSITTADTATPLRSGEEQITLAPPQSSYSAYVDTMTLSLDQLAEKIAAQIYTQFADKK